MEKYLILNADDFGQSEAANQAIMHLLEERKVSSATIMPPASAFEQAAAWFRKQKAANIGLHLTLTSEIAALPWKSLTGDPSLEGPDGRMHATIEAFERQSDPKAVVREMQAQFQAVKQAGLTVSHADNHMGSLYGLATGRSYLPQVLWQCSRRGLPFRLFRWIDPRDKFLASIPGAEQALRKVVHLADTLGVPIPDYLLSHTYGVEEGETYESFKQMMLAKLYDLPEGICETYIHPAAEDEHMSALVPSWEKRVWEYKLMQGDDFAYALRDAKVALATYDDVRKYRKKPRLKSAAVLLRSLMTRQK